MKQKTIAELAKCLVAVSMGEQPPAKTWIEVVIGLVEEDFKELQREIEDKDTKISLLREFVENLDKTSMKEQTDGVMLAKEQLLDQLIGGEA